MGMTIDEAKVQLSMQKFYVLGKDYEAVQVAIDTMRKYQKIQKILEKSSYKRGGKSYSYLYDEETRVKHIRKVMENGNDNN